MANDQSQSAALWEDLKQLLSSVVAEMNHTAELRRRTGGLECRVEDGGAIVVSKNSFPQMYVTVCMRAEAVDVNSRMVLSEADESARDFQESFAISVDDSGASLRSAEGDAFTTEQAVHYILRPLLHIGTAGC